MPGAMTPSPSKKRSRPYNREERAMALAVLQSEGWPGQPKALARVALRIKVPRETLRYWWNTQGRLDEVTAELRRAKCEQLADAFNDLAWRAVAQSGDRMDEASAYQAACIAGISTEKEQLLRGNPTAIHAHSQSGPQLTPEQTRAFQAFLREARAAATPVTGTDATVTAPALCAHTEPATVSTGADATATAPLAPAAAQAPTHSGPRA